MQSVRHAVMSVVERGRIGRKRSFAIAVVVALLALPPLEVLAYLIATGTGTASNVQAVATAPSTVTVAVNPAYTYLGPSTTALAPGGQVDIQVTLTCTAGAPCKGGPAGLALQSWTSDKVGCDSATLPGSFTVANTGGAIPNFNIAAINGTAVGDILINWVNLGVNQNACLGAKFAFVLVTA